MSESIKSSSGNGDVTNGGEKVADAAKSIITRHEAPLGWLIVNRPQVKNALNFEAWRGIVAAMDELNADPDVMAHMQKTMSREESDAFVARIEEEFDDCGFGLWAVEVPNHSPFIGFVGLHRVPFDAPFTPAVEVGWRLTREHWGYGFVTEAARSAVRYGLEEVGLDEIVSFTNPDNVRSWKVMERLGMIRDPSSDFEHPNVPTGHWLRPHIFYRFPPAAPSP